MEASANHAAAAESYPVRPLRLIVPGWYGAPNVKWLSEIVAQQDPYMGKFQTRWYRTLREENIGGVRVVKAFAQEQRQLRRFNGLWEHNKTREIPAFERRRMLRDERHRLVSEVRRRDGTSQREINAWLNRKLGITSVDDALLAIAAGAVA